MIILPFMAFVVVWMVLEGHQRHLDRLYAGMPEQRRRAEQNRTARMRVINRRVYFPVVVVITALATTTIMFVSRHDPPQHMHRQVAPTSSPPVSGGELSPGGQSNSQSKTQANTHEDDAGG